MVETIGKKLRQARLAKGLSLDEAAHATRVRPDKLIALENDDHSRFGSTAYAKGFLQIYGRFLGVDVSDQVALMETPRHVSISDYQYLNNAPQPEPTRVQFQRYGQRPSVVPLVVALGLMVIGAVAMVGYWVNVNMQRLELKDPAQTAVRTPAAPATVGTASMVPMPSNPMPRVTEPGLAPVSNPQPAANTGEVPAGGAAPSAEPVAGVPAADQPTGTSASAANELVVEPLKKTWVKIRRDSSTATPIFEDYLYPGVRPLTLRGPTFYVEVRDQDSVQIRKNGSPIAYQAPGISIQ